MFRHLTMTAVALGLCVGPASATLLLYDGFEAGGTTPAAGQYQSQPASTTGSNNNALEGQSPVLTGFSGVDAWSRIGPVSANVYARVNDVGLDWTSATGQTLVTSQGAAEIFRSGAPAGSLADNRKGGRRDTTASVPGGLPAEGIYFSGLFQFNEAFLNTPEEAFVGFRQGPSFARTHFVGFNNQGNLIAGTENTGGASVEVFAANQTHFVIALFRDEGGGNRFVDLWINPLDLSVEFTPDYTFASDYVGNNTNLDQILRLELQANMQATNPSIIFDEIRLGTTWESVTPFTVLSEPDNGAVVPEPATLSLLGMAGTMLLIRRRRTQA